MLSSLPRSCGEGWGPGRERRTPQEETTPGHSFEQTKPGTSGARGRGNRDITKWQGARVPGLLQVYTLHTEPSPDPRGQQKILFSFPPSLRNPFSHSKIQTW